MTNAMTRVHGIVCRKLSSKERKVCMCASAKALVKISNLPLELKKKRKEKKQITQAKMIACIKGRVPNCNSSRPPTSLQTNYR